MLLVSRQLGAETTPSRHTDPQQLLPPLPQIVQLVVMDILADAANVRAKLVEGRPLWEDCHGLRALGVRRCVVALQVRLRLARLDLARLAMLVERGVAHRDLAETARLVVHLR